jgi:membrane protease YdiL (CAAX protease family)
MSFLQNANKGNNNVSTYILTISMVLIAYMLVGQIPLMVELSIFSEVVKDFQNENPITITNYLGKNKFLVYIIIPFIFTLITLLLAVKFLHKRPILSVITNRTRFDWKRFFTMFFIWGMVMALFLMLSMFSNASITRNFNAATFFPLLLISFFLIPLQTACEEVLFRGYLFQGFGQLYKKGWISVVLTGLLFGLLHSANPEVETLGYGVMVYYIGTGIFLGLLTLMDDGLELSMGYHVVNNIFAALILTNEWQAFQTDALFMDHSKPTFGWDSILTILVIQPLFLLLFSKVYGWKNWKKKLFS